MSDERERLHEPSRGNPLGFNRDRRRQHAITANMLRGQGVDMYPLRVSNRELRSGGIDDRHGCRAVSS